MIRPGLRGDDAWMTRALCREHDPEMWFSEHASVRADAARICHKCPVIDDCRAAGTGEKWGVWAGESHNSFRAQDARWANHPLNDETRWTEQGIRAAKYRYGRGGRDMEAVIGQRIYDRMRARQRRRTWLDGEVDAS